MLRAAAIFALLAVTLPGRAGGADAPGNRYRIHVEIQAGLRQLDGSLEARIANDRDVPIDAFTLWLYPEVFASPLAGVTPVNREYYQPAGPGRGGIELLEPTLDGRPIMPVLIDVPPAPPGTAWLVELPAPLEPGATVELAMRFRTLVPERLGPLSTTGRILTATGGWHPYLTAGDARESGVIRRPPDSMFRVSVRAPPRFTALVGERGGPLVEFVGPFVPLWVRPPAVRPIHTAAGRIWPETARPEAGQGCSFPDPASIEGEWVGDLVAETHRRIHRWADESGLPGPGSIDLFLVPLASELALATGGGVAVSDRIYSVPPLGAVRRLHDRALARAILAERLLPWVRERETSEAVPQVADALGASLSTRFLEETQGETADVTGLLSLLDFVPSLDAFLRSPKSAFPHVYFLPVTEPIPVRDEPWTFNVEAPRGNLPLAKTADLIGEPALARAIDRYLDPGSPPATFLDALEEASGEELGSFWRAWNERSYREDLRVRIAAAEPLAEGGFRTEIELVRVGDAPPEAIEVLVESGGERLILAWRAGAGEHAKLFEIETDAPVDRVRVDPRRRVTQAASDPSQVPALGDVDPGRLQLLLTRVGLAYSVPDRSPYGEFELTLRRRENVRQRFGLGAAYRKSRIGARSFVSFGFGPLIDAARYAYIASVGIEGDYLRSGFGGEGARAGFALGPTFSLVYDDRPPVPTQDRGNAWATALSASVGQASGGNPGYYSGASLGGLHLEPLGRGHALAMRLRGSLLAGAPPIQELLALGGTDEGLRGFTHEEVLGARRFVGGLEWRLPLLRALDENLLAARLRSVGGVVFAEGAWMGDIRGPDGHAASPGDGFFGDFGVGLRFRYDFLGVQPLVISMDAALPLGRPERIERPAVTLQLRSGQPFSIP